MNFQDNIYQFIQRQLEIWPLAKENFTNLQQTLIKELYLSPSVKVYVQYNPKRIQSTNAKLDNKSIATRQCFLCKQNLPLEEISLNEGHYHLHVNPYPILPNHLVIAHNQHIPQEIDGHIQELLYFAQKLPAFAVFFNGISCGASAPDHLHLQAVECKHLPLMNDYIHLKKNIEEISAEGCTIYSIPEYFRTIYCIESNDRITLENAYNNLIYSIFKLNEKKIMINILCTHNKGVWSLFLFPRKQSRPWQFNAEGDRQLMVSPATIEMSGIIITPIESHFERITAKDIIDIYKQVSL